MIELKGKCNKDCIIYTDEIEQEAYSLIQGILDEKPSEGVPIRIMPDTHAGKDIVIGFTMPMTEYVNPNWIGVDIGCSVSTYKLSLKDEDISLPLFDTQIRDIIPMGTNIRKKSILDEKEFLKSFKRNLSSFHSKYTEHSGINYDLPTINEKWLTQMFKRIGIEPGVFYNSIGTLGGGNHFIEIGKNDKGDYFLTIHTGSRNFGLKVAKYHTNQAKFQKDSSDEEYSKRLDEIRDNTKDKSSIPELIKELKNELNLGVNKKYLREEFAFNYLVDMIMAQTYAQFNHDSIQRERYVRN